MTFVLHRATNGNAVGFLGKGPAQRPFGLANLSAYTVGKIGAPPSSVHYGGLVGVAFGMDANGPDPLVTNQGPDFVGCGDCVLAEKDHALKVGNAIINHLLDLEKDAYPTPTPNEIATEYYVLTGGVDSGLVIADTLKLWNTTGLFGTKIEAYVPVNYQSLVELHQAVWLCGIVEIGIQVQQAQMDQFDAGEPWVWEPNQPSIGGHDVCISGYDSGGVWVVTWGRLQYVTYQFLSAACEEAWGVILPEIAKAGEGATKIDLVALKADLPQLD